MDKLPAAWMDALRTAAREAGERIMTYYGAAQNARMKNDRSPVTDADIAAHEHIMRALAALTPDITVVSEEAPVPDAAPQQFWLVDPLDGTRGFIRGEGEFTVNIALIENAAPVLGVIYVPVTGAMYWGGRGAAAYRALAGEGAQQMTAADVDAEALRAVVSTSHASPKTDAFLAQYRVAAKTSAASSLKFCLVAEGGADIYPRIGPTMEWDTAAGHAILLAAGGTVETLDGAPLTYGKPEFRNPHFVAWGRRG